jgi:hypothetical protein
MRDTRADVVALGSEHRLNELDRQVWQQFERALDGRACVRNMIELRPSRPEPSPRFPFTAGDLQPKR